MRHLTSIKKNRLYTHISLCVVATCLFFLYSSPTYAFQIDFSETVTFGDSLTHNDLIWIVSGQPRAMYGDDPHQAVFNKAAIAGDDLTSYAIAGSTSDDTSIQIDLYDFFRIIGSQQDATLFGYEIGGNDILNNADLLMANAPGTNPEADAVIDNLINNIQGQITQLKHDNKPSVRFIIWTVPDVTFTPRFFGQLNSNQIQNLQAHTERVNELIRSADRFNFISVIDIFKAIGIMVNNPPVIKGQQLLPPPTYGEFNALFADDIHPTAVSNAIIANFIITTINKKWHDNIPLYTEDELAALAHIQ